MTGSSVFYALPSCPRCPAAHAAQHAFRWSEDGALLLQSVLGVPEDLVFESCSEKVGEALGPDVMKSVKPLVPDILSSIPLLLYQGQPLWEQTVMLV